MPLCGACNALSCGSMCLRTVIVCNCFLFINNTDGSLPLFYNNFHTLMKEGKKNKKTKIFEG